MSATARLDAPPSALPPAAPAAPTLPLAAPVPAALTLPVHRVTAEEYERWIELGALGPEDKVELLEGLIIDKMPDGLPHAHALRKVTAHFFRCAADRWVTQNQSGVRLTGPSLPEPDLALLQPPEDAYARRRPAPADVFLLIEVSETSLATDRGDKLRAYARAGVPEYWIVNLPERVVEVHRDPEPEAARYGSTRFATVAEQLAPAAFPDAVLAVGTLFG